MRPYSVVTPPFDLVSGGIRVMYALHGWLMAKGQITHISATYENKDFVAIYPEVYRGNMTKAKNIVRYIMAKPGYVRLYGIPGPKTFDPTDQIFVFSELYNEFGVDDDHVMFLPMLNLHLFRDQGKPRTKTAYFVGKGVDIEKHPKGSIKINKAVVNDQQGLADLLNECHTLYGYDPVSAMYEISRLCGCRVVLIPEGHYTKEQWQKYEPGMNGVSWGLDENVPLDAPKFRQHYIDMIDVFSHKLDRFIELTQDV